MSTAFIHMGLGGQNPRPKTNRERISMVVVDDSPVYQQLVCSLMEFEDDFDVVGRADDGTEALKVVQKLRPQLVLMDVNMPHMNGLETAKTIAGCFPEIKIALMSIEDSTHLREKIMTSGAHAFVGKRRFREDFAIAVEQLFFDDVPPGAA